MAALKSRFSWKANFRSLLDSIKVTLGSLLEVGDVCGQFERANWHAWTLYSISTFWRSYLKLIIKQESSSFSTERRTDIFCWTPSPLNMALQLFIWRDLPVSTCVCSEKLNQSFLFLSSSRTSPGSQSNPGWNPARPGVTGGGQSSACKLQLWDPQDGLAGEASQI